MIDSVPHSNISFESLNINVMISSRNELLWVGNKEETIGGNNEKKRCKNGKNRFKKNINRYFILFPFFVLITCITNQEISHSLENKTVR